MVLQFVWKKEWPDYDYSLTHGLKPMDWLDSQGLGNIMIGKLVRKTSGE